MRRRERDLHRWVELMEQLSLLLDEAVLPIPQALRCAADGTAMPDRLLQRIAEAIEANPLLSLPDAFSQLCPDGPEREPLLRMSVRLARGSAESRLLAVSQTLQTITLLEQQARERVKRDAKLVATLGWTCGFALSLMLL